MNKKVSEFRRVLRQIWWPLMLTHLGLIAERCLRSFWPFITLILFFLAFGLLDVQSRVEEIAFWLGIATHGSLILMSLVWGVWKFQLPNRKEAISRLDKSMAARPLRGIRDFQLLGANDPDSKQMWEHHRSRLISILKKIDAVAPDFKLSAQDPFGFRFLALLIFTLGLIFGSISNFYNISNLKSAKKENLVNSPHWEGWIMPPDYSALPTLYLNDLIGHPELAVLKGSKVELHLYGENGNYTLTETLSDQQSQIALEKKPKQIFEVVKAGKINIEGPTSTQFDVALSPDYPPSVSWNGKFDTDFYGESTLVFGANDDFGVVSGVMQVELDFATLERKYGLAVDPREKSPMIIDLPLPLNGERLEFEAEMVENFSKSVWANLPVRISLQAMDAVQQMGKSEAVTTRLPGRKFFDPLAAALIEQRRDLLWSDFNALRVANVLRALSSGDKEIFRKETDYLRLRFIIIRLEAAFHKGLLEAHRNQLAEAIWSLALSIEEFDVEDALERMRRAQERLSQAMKNGASKEEITELMQELRRANEDYLRQLSRNAERKFDKNRQIPPDRKSMTLSQNDIQDMMERIEELMEEGRMAEAQKALQELQEMIENMQVAEGEIGEGRSDEEVTDGLIDTLREQEKLSDEAFSHLQKQFERQQNGQGNSAQGNGTGLIEKDGIVRRQDSLREKLESQRKALPDLEKGGGSRAQRLLKETEKAMREAGKALREGDFSEALDEQADAMENLRDAVRSLAQSLTKSESSNTEQGATTQSGNPKDRNDPLGRTTGNGSKQIDQKSDLVNQGAENRTEEILKEIRRRSGEFERSDDEKRYLKRLLDKF